MAWERAMEEQTCAFCDRSAAEVARLIVGERAAICDECVSTCVRLTPLPLAGGEPRMSSRYEQVLERNRADTPQSWQSFARRVDPICDSESLMWNRLAHDYKSAADIVARESCNSYKHRDTLHSPIFWLYRHYIELVLKYFWREYFSLGWLDWEPPDDEHNLLILWRTIRKTSEAHGLFSADDKFIDQVEKSINHFNTLDKRSMHSRYPEVGGKYHSLHIGIEKHICAADDLDTLFYGLRAEIQEYESYMSECWRAWG
jgi:hypothetical protein